MPGGARRLLFGNLATLVDVADPHRWCRWPRVATRRRRRKQCHLIAGLRFRQGRSLRGPALSGRHGSCAVLVAHLGQREQRGHQIGGLRLPGNQRQHRRATAVSPWRKASLATLAKTGDTAQTTAQIVRHIAGLETFEASHDVLQVGGTTGDGRLKRAVG